MTMATKKVDVVIIGGSLAGLFCAICLQSLPNISSITILERYHVRDLHDLGAGIRCNTEANDAILHCAGISRQEYAIHLGTFRFLAQDGTVAAQQEADSWVTTWGQLFRAFRKRLDAVTQTNFIYRHGCTLTGLQDLEGGKVQVEYQDEEQRQQTMLTDLVIGADGASSKVRSLLDATATKRTSAGYVAYRGVVPQKELSPAAFSVFDGSGVFSWPEAGQLVSYIVPSDEAPADQSTRCVNWVWYRMKTEDALRSLMTDTSGKVHAFSLPHGKMREEEIIELREAAKLQLPAVCVEIMGKTPQPFVQVVTDSMASRTTFFNGKVLLVGDAVGGQRPHTASAIMQMSHHGIMVQKYFNGDVDISQFEEQTKKLSRVLVEGGQNLGDIIMVEGPRTPKITGAFMNVFIKIQTDLNDIWKDAIGIGNATPQM